jgi:adenylate kinase family enzyme
MISRLRIVLLGLPGSGKGTQGMRFSVAWVFDEYRCQKPGKWIARDFNLNLISTGDVLRDLMRMKPDAPLAQFIGKQMQGGGGPLLVKRRTQSRLIGCCVQVSLVTTSLLNC